MEIKGYKAFNKNKTNRYGKRFIEGVWYSCIGDNIVFGTNGNGYHMCKELSDVFRYFDPNNVVVASVIGDGDYSVKNDEYYGYYDMYSVRNIYIERFLTREEIIDKMLNEVVMNNVIKFVQTFPLNEDEIKLFLEKFGNNYKIVQVINYYQILERDKVFALSEDGIKKVKKYG